LPRVSDHLVPAGADLRLGWDGRLSILTTPASPATPMAATTTASSDTSTMVHMKLMTTPSGCNGHCQTRSCTHLVAPRIASIVHLAGTAVLDEL